jgi:quercetin dioxygenase-like cupin family protein
MKTTFEQVLNLRDSVEYQPNAVIRTTIMQQEGGSATLVGLDGKEGEEHSTPFAAMIVVVEGEIEFIIEGTPHRVREGEYILMSPNKKHMVRPIERSKLLRILLRV